MLDETVSQINFKEILDFTKMDEFVENLFSNWRTDNKLEENKETEPCAQQ
jgi:hypothetical protein